MKILKLWRPDDLNSVGCLLSISSKEPLMDLKQDQV